MKIFTVRRGGNKRWDKDYPDTAYFAKNGEWDYQWVKRNFGVILKPGEIKRFRLVEVGKP